MSKNESTLEISIPISKQAIASLLTSAFEGGANYWYMIEEVNVPEPSDQVRYLDGDDDGGKFWDLYDGPLCKGFLSGNYDANTGDVFLQCCLFGEIVYG